MINPIVYNEFYKQFDLKYFITENKFKTKLFISPPFGNYSYIHKLFPNNVINIRGSFTLEPRHGLWGQVFKTLRYSTIHNGWINKIGLRNPGIDYAIDKYYNKLSINERKKNIVSIAILNESDIPLLKQKIPKDMNLEINISCPNTENELIYNGISTFLNGNREWCIVKLSPIVENKIIDNLYSQGFRQFHCSNTIPVLEGGLSGPSLKSYSNQKINYISIMYPDCEIIAGGGIQSINDIKEYSSRGAHYFSISTLLFNPFKTIKFFYDFNNNFC